MQRHITWVLENTRVFDEKYPGIFQYPGFMISHYQGIDKYPGIFHQIPGYLTACQISGQMTAETTCGLYRHIYPVCEALPTSVYRVLRELLLLKGGN